jgi:hypothetical protein
MIEITAYVDSPSATPLVVAVIWKRNWRVDPSVSPRSQIVIAGTDCGEEVELVHVCVPLTLT